jgi:hypothetical protein
MNRSQDDEKSRWDQVMEHFDMLFTRVNDIGEIQQDMKKQLNDNSAKVDNCTAEQKFIAQQVRANGQTMAQLTIRQFEEDDKYVSDAPESMIVEEEENPFATAYAKTKVLASLISLNITSIDLIPTDQQLYHIIHFQKCSSLHLMELTQKSG